MHWVIGDIHGMLRPLQRLLDAVLKADSEAHFIFTGDYINRGPDSAKVIDLLLTLSSATFIRGNHDDIFDLVLHEDSYAPNAADGGRAVAFQWFMQYGMDTTFLSYGVDYAWLTWVAEHPTPALLTQLADFVPAEHKQFIRELPPMFETDEFFVVHGKWGPDETESPSVAERVQENDQLRQGLLWGRYTLEEIWQEKPWNRRGFFGHTPVHSYFPEKREGPVPLRGPQITLVDTGAAVIQWGRLSACCVETDQVIQITHFGEPVPDHRATR